MLVLRKVEQSLTRKKTEIDLYCITNVNYNVLRKVKRNLTHRKVGRGLYKDNELGETDWSLTQEVEKHLYNIKNCKFQSHKEGRKKNDP